jgi:hypothetical protein
MRCKFHRNLESRLCTHVMDILSCAGRSIVLKLDDLWQEQHTFEKNSIMLGRIKQGNAAVRLKFVP